MSSNPRFSNVISNIDINSYRAYKKLLKSGKPGSLEGSKKDSGLIGNLGKTRINNNNENFIQAKNLTRHIFSSQSKRFEWQTNEAINRHSELTGSLSSKRQQSLNSDNWEGLINRSQDEQSIKNYEKNKKLVSFFH